MEETVQNRILFLVLGKKKYKLVWTFLRIKKLKRNKKLKQPISITKPGVKN